MNPTTKKVLWGVGIGCVVFAALVAVAGYLFWTRLMRPIISKAESTTEPASAGPVGVSVGKGFLVHKGFASGLKTGAVGGLATGKLDPRPEVALVAAGEEGAAFLTRDGALVSAVRFAQGSTSMSVIDVEGDGVCEFMVRGEWAEKPAVLNHDGTLRWRYDPGRDAVDDMAAGDMDGDGFLEFAVGCNGGGGVRLLDHEGNERWRRSDADVWHCEIGDVMGRGRPQVVYSDAAGEIVVRDASGNVVHRGTGYAYVSDFTLVPWPAGSSDPLRVLAGYEGAVRVFDGDAKVLAKFDAPHAGDDPIRATWVRLKPGVPAHLAVLITRDLADRALLYVYDTSGKLVYQEVLSESAAALAVLPQANGAEALLVGGRGRVLKYVPAGPK